MRSSNVTGYLRIGAILALGTLCFFVSDLDLRISSHFYLDGEWYLAERQPFLFLYEFGNIPGLAMGITGLTALILSFRVPKLATNRKLWLLLMLSVAVGPGLVVNSVFKEHYGRPRPKQVVAFGGDKPFVPVGVPSRHDGPSFPSGHAAMAFVLLTPYFWYRRRNRQRALLWLALGLVYGAMMSLTRIVQGGHWASDTFWSFGFVYLVGHTLAILLRLDPEPDGAAGAGAAPEPGAGPEPS